MPRLLSVSDETLIRVGYQLCQTREDRRPLEQRAVVLLFDDTAQFELAELGILEWASALATPMCQGDLQSVGPDTYQDLADDFGAAFTQEQLDQLRTIVVDGMRQAVAQATVAGAPAVAAVEDLTLLQGHLSLRLTPANEGPAGSTDAACAAAVAVHQVRQALDPQPTFFIALALGAPELTMDVTVVDRSELLFTRSAASDLEQLANGDVDCDTWRDTTKAQP
jgi:hypothetical protein